MNDCYFIYKKGNHMLLADKAYESKKVRSKLLNHNCQLIIPKKKNTKTEYFFDKHIYKKRIIIENTFQKLKSFRRIMIRYDSLFITYSAFVYFGMSLLIYRSL